ncbi:alpha/beta hydrolase [Pseudidiomarina aestuarii]|uniref:Alpha/beta hydrolase n=1 Tax=Pseudidiomarina aestuarii TaxID=624146 RepID=A0A7Z7ETR0_9GAMM|nr:alpha/beta hydrolase [Pseudidiomarina aestuarii]RUO41275.1 alpha/beta hydrolase [Pseudidiomarina aestuarii]
MTTQPLKFNLETETNRVIAVQHWPQPVPEQVIIMAPAMGVPQSYYQNFCQWLAQQGRAVISFDYFGIGASLQGPLKQQHTTIREWAELDAAAVIAHTQQLYPTASIIWFAHSVSGQLFGMIPNYSAVDRMITVATGSGYWRENTPQLKPKAWLLWHIIAPLTLPMFGYFPGDKLGIVGNLPGAAMRQWRRWCLHPEYLIGVEGEANRQRYAKISTPITSISFSDDELLSQRNIHAMHDAYVNAPQQRLCIEPQSVGLERIGHFGFFRQRLAGSSWDELILPHLSNSSPEPS